MLDNGVIRRTTPFQRVLHKPATSIAAPAVFQDLVAHGYVSPTYAWQPENHEWSKQSDGTVTLKSRDK